MNLGGQVLAFVAVFLALVAVTLYLRFRGVLSSAHAPLFSALITEAVMPAMILGQVARTQVHFVALSLAAVIVLTETLSGGLALLLGRFLFRLDRTALSTFILGSSFGSTSLIGNALLKVVFVSDKALQTMGVVIGQFGVGLPNNTAGLLIGMSATQGEQRRPIGQLLRGFLLSAPVLALAGGILWGAFQMPVRGDVMTPIFRALTLLAAGLPFMAALVTGLTMRRVNLRRAMPLILSSQAIQLLLQPLVAVALMSFIPVGASHWAITVLLCGMPASPLTVVYASRYGGDSDLASALVMSSNLLSAITLPLVAFLA